MKITNKQLLLYAIAKLDSNIKQQLQLIIDLPEVKALLSLWLQTSVLVHLSIDNHLDRRCHIKILDIQWNELDKDLNTALELEDSSLFQHVYEQEFGRAGGEPFSLLLANYQLDLRKLTIISALNRLGELGAFSLAPVITNLSPLCLEQDSFNSSEILGRELKSPSLKAWERIRHSPHARFINVVVPQAELVLNPPASNFLLNIKKIEISGASLLTARIIQSFQQTLWFNEIAGFFNFKSLVEKSEFIPFNHDNIQLACNFFIGTSAEQLLSNQGCIPLIQSNTRGLLYFGNNYCAFLGDDLTGLLLEHILASCRLAHNIKILARDKIGLHANEADCEIFIKNWLKRYTANISNPSLRYQYPLKAFQVKLSKVPGKPGYYSCQILLEPHMKLENMNTKIILHSEILTNK